ncbi:FUN14 domain-containing protein 1-like isoform X2 [Ruditapes philippinarum]|uniref:FUN14 domain-containing protein 1-like isoform X2 n=1 Tax=Ruditapes philippinarum TaxID=129788 RepID=UPI00295BC58C|nr:FUN14 domain-containing protein 1-like isoform X2 [Ruditapes philippinarum]
MKMDENEDDFEVLDLGAFRRNKSRLENILGDISKQSAAKQVVIGGAAGWFSGYLFIKVGKIAACSLGTTVLLIQIAQHQGYIQINWSKVNKEVTQAKRKVQREANRQFPQLVDNLRRFAQENMFLAGSFVGGFFIGLAF